MGTASIALALNLQGKPIGVGVPVVVAGAAGVLMSVVGAWVAASAYRQARRS